jgi:exodeoxyribonuclease VII large subunit
MEQFLLQFEPQRRLYSVAELNAAIRGVLDREFSDVWVAGEISGTKQAASGHWYFTLKERDSQLRCVCFRGTARFLKFKPQDGIAVLARGRVEVYEQRGEYQLLVEFLEPQGLGALQLAFEQLKRKLAAEGLFDSSRKRPLPRLPLRVGIVTSPRGAVIQDMLNILPRRFPGIHIRLYPAVVQGERAVEEVCAGLAYFAQSGWPQVIIVARGGGSLEDLWSFNEEEVARAIAASPVPVISAIGHESDFTIADFAADLRAPTPSAAAELVICTRTELLESLDYYRQKLAQSLRYRLLQLQRRLHEQGTDRAVSVLRRRIGRSLQRVDDLDYRLRECMRSRLESNNRRLHSLEVRLRHLDLRLRMAGMRQRLEACGNALSQSMRWRLTHCHRLLAPLEAQLRQLSPLRILDRGYAIVTDEAGRLLKSATGVDEGERLRIRLAEGELRAKVTGSEPAEEPES